MSTLYKSPFNLAVLAAGLGFFVDAFDLFLFNIYRIPSLKELGLTGAELTHIGENLLAIQMLGMMVGGVLSGIIADYHGRVYVLFGSILLYSLANIANSFVTDVDTYAIIRFLAGVGLAGELGTGITLVSESMTKEKRGYGTILVATLGALGAVCAGLSGDFLPWRDAFLYAGIAGLVLVLFRFNTMEPSIFRNAKENNSKITVSFKLFFTNKKRFLTYLACILMGVPIWYSVGLLITFTPEIMQENGLTGTKLSLCFILFQCGVTIGDLSSGLLSQYFKSRKKILFAYMAFACLASLRHFILIYTGQSLNFSSFLIGLGCGYLSVFVTSTAEHFGTNLRATATSTVTNFMRGAITILIPMTLFFQSKFQITLTASLIPVGILVWLAALLAVYLLPETYGKELNYLEE